MFSKVLIANRGEIAVRIMQTCAELGIRTVAVYSEADSSALHVRRADESYLIGPAAASESYLNIPKIIAVAQNSGAEAIHPGYGFLAENPTFAESCRQGGIAFVGPSPEAMHTLGDKVAAKSLARRVGVPVVPGYDGNEQSLAALGERANALGFPIMLKAAAGGGGRGMRIVHRQEDFEQAIDSAKREARTAFGDDTMFLERHVAAARHIEVQVLADSHGKVVSIGERDCSLQRRRQKVIEESPAPGLSHTVREALSRDATALVVAAAYTNAATVEFLVTPSGDYYFLEVNTRLQVEHPVTEAVSGVDLVAEQIRIAAGMELSLRQSDVVLRGHALECRVCAEDPRHDFVPATGHIRLFTPPTGAGIRNDVGVETGDTVTEHYDSLLAKLVVWAGDRDTCIARARNALRRYEVQGVVSNVALLERVLGSDDVRRGAMPTSWLEDHISELATQRTVPHRVLLAAAGWLLLDENVGMLFPWRVARQAIVISLWLDEKKRLIEASHVDGGTWDVTVADVRSRTTYRRAGPSTLRCRTDENAWTASILVDATSIRVAADGDLWVLQMSVPAQDEDALPVEGPATRGTLRAPMPGTVVRIAVRNGDKVHAGQLLLVIEAMKTEIAINAPHAGTVRRVRYALDDFVPLGAILVEIDS